MSQQPILQNGKLRFALVGPDGNETPVEADLIELKLICEQVEEKHNLQVVNGEARPTPEFLADLAGVLQGCGFEGCTSTQAWQVWVTVGKSLVVLKKNIV